MGPNGCFRQRRDGASVPCRFPEIAAWKFWPDVAAECANTLIQAGRDSACDHPGRRRREPISPRAGRLSINSSALARPTPRPGLYPTPRDSGPCCDKAPSKIR